MVGNLLIYTYCEIMLLKNTVSEEHKNLFPAEGFDRNNYSQQQHSHQHSDI